MSQSFKTSAACYLQVFATAMLLFAFFMPWGPKEEPKIGISFDNSRITSVNGKNCQEVFQLQTQRYNWVFGLGTFSGIVGMVGGALATRARPLRMCALLAGSAFLVAFFSEIISLHEAISESQRYLFPEPSPFGIGLTLTAYFMLWVGLILSFRLSKDEPSL